jgi:uncharacterized membrane protein
MWQEPPWHPMIVHFPLALTVIATLCLIGGRLVKREATASALYVVGSWNLCLGAATALMGVASGIGASMNLKTTLEAAHSITVHLYCAIVSTLLLVFLAIWRGAATRGSGRPSAAFLTLLISTTFVLIVTGYFGGENVFRYGVGVAGH